MCVCVRVCVCVCVCVHVCVCLRVCVCMLSAVVPVIYCWHVGLQSCKLHLCETCQMFECFVFFVSCYWVGLLFGAVGGGGGGSPGSPTVLCIPMGGVPLFHASPWGVSHCFVHPRGGCPIVLCIPVGGVPLFCASPFDRIFLWCAMYKMLFIWCSCSNSKKKSKVLLCTPSYIRSWAIWADAFSQVRKQVTADIRGLCLYIYNAHNAINHTMQ